MKPVFAAGWGNYPVRQAFLHEEDLARTPKLESDSALVRGMARSYGDACLGPVLYEGRTWRRFLGWDGKKAELTLEGGVSLDEILLWSVPRGYFLAVTPGTRYVTVAGALASDVHGKNHHGSGAFSDTVTAFDMLLANGKTLRVTRTAPKGLFAATAGGMGLTGVILRVTLRLTAIPSSFIMQRVERVANLQALMDLIEARAGEPFSMAWVDANAKGKDLGRGHLLSGHWATEAETSARGMVNPFVPHGTARLRFPFALPGFVLAGPALKWAAQVYHRLPRPYGRESLVHYGKFFYPLDGILDWNRAYGKAGFVQWQCVLPPSKSREGIEAILDEVHRRKQYAFVTVLKQFGEGNGNPLSFPMKGYTFCMDFRQQPGVEELMAALDERVSAWGGRIYLAKDARMSRKTFETGYPQHRAFSKVKRAVDPRGLFRSDQSDRLGLTTPNGKVQHD